MGVINATPDSFSDGNQFIDPDRAANHAGRMVGAGAHIIDVGGESTRPGAEPVSIETESDRVLPVIRALQHLNTVISIDTRHATIADRALRAGAHLINDVAALRHPDMTRVAVDHGVPVVIVHTPVDDPQTMQDHASYADVMQAIVDDLGARVALARDAGIREIIIDPGIGFGKTTAHNIEILNRLAELRCLGCPILVGASRKSFIGDIVGASEPTKRDPGSIVAHLHAVRNGARLLRVHDVAGHRQALAMSAALSPTPAGAPWSATDHPPELQ